LKKKNKNLNEKKEGTRDRRQTKGNKRIERSRRNEQIEKFYFVKNDK